MYIRKCSLAAAFAVLAAGFCGQVLALEVTPSLQEVKLVKAHPLSLDITPMIQELKAYALQELRYPPPAKAGPASALRDMTMMMTNPDLGAGAAGGAQHVVRHDGYMNWRTRNV